MEHVPSEEHKSVTLTIVFFDKNSGRTKLERTLRLKRKAEDTAAQKDLPDTCLGPLQALRREGLADVRHTTRIFDWNASASLADFDPGYLQVDVSPNGACRSPSLTNGSFPPVPAATAFDPFLPQANGAAAESLDILRRNGDRRTTE